MPRVLLVPFLVLFVVLAAIGCSRTSTVGIQHPMRLGAVPPNRVPHTYPGVEQQNGLPPGSLTDEASLVRMDAEAVCVDVTLRNLQAASDAVDLQGYSMLLTSSTGLSASGPTVSLKAMEAATFMGQVPEQRVTGETTECVDTDPNTQQCRRWETRPTYSTVMVPGPVTVVAGGGVVCFPNGGRVTPATTDLKLELSRGGGTLGFEWEFVGGGGPPQAVPAQTAAR